MNNNIYFGGSIRGGRDDSEIYFSLIQHLKKYGHVLTEHIGDKGLSQNGEVKLADFEIHDRDVNLLRDSRFLVMEVTQASLGVGYEIGRIIERNLWVPSTQRKDILCLYRQQVDKRLSAMINGCKGLSVIRYSSLNEAIEGIDTFFLKAIK
jgi:hypothetical protein